MSAPPPTLTAEVMAHLIAEAIEEDGLTQAEFAQRSPSVSPRLSEGTSEPEPTRQHPAFVHNPPHMKGWEAFGVVGPDQSVTVRRLGLVTFPKGGGGATTEERPGTEKWGPGEVKLGVASIEYGTFADSTEGGYLYVCGTEREDVERRWHEAAAALLPTHADLWPKSRAAAPVRPSGETTP